MNAEPDTYYQALLARDRRFDGWFFVGVSSTGIYCRPVCAVRTPKFENCRFFGSAAAAEKQGFRPCLRCRPELAPGHGVLDVSATLARTAAGLIDAGFLNEVGVPQLAARIGITERHLRRIFAAEFGVSVIEYAQTQRLLLAKRLLTDSALPIGEIAYASGFASLRRFNDVFQQHYRLSPRALRKRTVQQAAAPQSLSFTLAYRPPYAWDALLDFLGRRAIAGVEHVADGVYWRSVALDVGAQAGARSGTQAGHPAGTRTLSGWIKIEHRPAQHSVQLSFPPSLANAVAPLLHRVRHLCDLACRPDLVDAHLGELAAGMPGLRVPGAFDGFEVAVRAIVGQQISVAGARTILGRIAARFGQPLDPDLGDDDGDSDRNSDGDGAGTPGASAPPQLRYLFPDAAAIAALPPDALRGVGMVHARSATIHALAVEIAAGRLTLAPLAPIEETLAALKRIKGIGDWTAQYIAMRALAWPNAFPAGDLVLKQQLGLSDARAVEHHAQAWAPWRAYAALHLWRLAAEA